MVMLLQHLAGGSSASREQAEPGGDGWQRRQPTFYLLGEGGNPAGATALVTGPLSSPTPHLDLSALNIIVFK